MLKDSSAALKSLGKLSKQRFSCHADVMKMLGIWIKSQASMSISDIHKTGCGMSVKKT